ncbi:hypothetical protein [Microtetraspora niveoalba]|uniref:hypothetical protein n=1 Tax=Microtetraspora niveoalba TaxID=46175 RepID=UPI00082AD070|nr:hypothetical protein [Microtetraspora niveoalba]
MLKPPLKYVILVAATLWGVSAVTALTDIGSMRLHITILMGALVVSFWAIAASFAGAMKGQVLNFDRGYTIGARGIVAGLVDAANQREAELLDQKARNYN